MNELVLIGSNGLRFHGIAVERKKLDCDFICTPKAFVSYLKEVVAQTHTLTRLYPSDDAKKMFAHTASKDGIPFVFEAELIWDGNLSEQFLELLKKDPKTLLDTTSPEGFQIYVPSLDVLYMLKMTHRYLKNSPHFLKTMADIHMLRGLGCEIPKMWKKWYKERIRATYDYSHPKLNVKKKDFFSDDNIDYVYDHDSIHEAVKHLDTPAYDKFKPDSAEVFTSKEMFFKLPKTIQLLATLEESYVLSLERAIIPFDLKKPEERKRAFDTALMKVCTSITSGWFREFSWENYHAVQSMYDQEYVERFWTAVAEGKVKPFKAENIDV